jgi:hypothetical protein
MNRDRPRDHQRLLVASLAALTFSLPAMLANAVKARMRPVAPRRDPLEEIPGGYGRTFNRSSRGRSKTNAELGCFPKKPRLHEWIGSGKTRRLVLVPTCEPAVHVRRSGRWTKYTLAQFAALNPLGLQAQGTIVEHVNSFGQVTHRERVRA